MGSERENYELSGPLHLTTIDWENTHHRRSVAASLVQGCYVLELDRQAKREESQALAPPWWESFKFLLRQQLIDDADNSIFGAIYQYNPTSPNCNCSPSDISPRFVIAFRGTLTKADSLSRDLQLDLHLIKNGLHLTSRSEIAMQAVRNIVAENGETNIWLAGHSLGASMAMLAGKNMAKSKIFIESFLFNPPFFSAPIERIKDTKMRFGLRIASSLLTAGLSVAVNGKQNRNMLEDPFDALSTWVPSIFVNPQDHICSEYVGYFEHRKRMEELGAGSIERLSTQNSVAGLLMNAIGKESEPLHLIPSANLTVNLSPAPDFKRAHGIHQWWKPDIHLQSNIYMYR